MFCIQLVNINIDNTYNIENISRSRCLEQAFPIEESLFGISYATKTAPSLATFKTKLKTFLKDQRSR